MAEEGAGTERASFGRRRFLSLAATAGGALAVGSAETTLAGAAAASAPAGSDLGAVEHVIFLMMENRSFDHYFGTYRGVRGFDDHRPRDLGVFSQAFPANGTRPPRGRQLPFRLRTTRDDASCTFDLSHAWGAQHGCRNGGAMDAFVQVHTAPENEGPEQGVLTMSYYTRADLPFYYALADAFTIGDAYHCSVLGPTHPNRLMQMSGTVDPAGRAGGPVLVTSQSPDILFSLRWPTMPEVLEDAGVSWKYYGPPGSLYSIETMHTLGITYDTVLPMFAQYQDPSSALYHKAFEQSYPDDLETDLQNDTLPQVSWIATPLGYDEHPPAPPFLGEWFTSQLLARLVKHPKIWATTVLFVMYDENDGFFDHVAPPSPPPGTTGEYLTVAPLPSSAEGIGGPVGLGFRVPLLVVSPFSRGGYVCSDVLDHTSQLRFLEERFGVRAPNISAWRRRTVGDLTGTLRPGRPDPSVPKLPATTNDPAYIAAKGCSTGDLLEVSDDQPVYPLAPVQSMPRQEPGRTRRARAGQRD